jgi:hypothetical protein
VPAFIMVDKVKAKQQLGIDPGTASNRLRKLLLFSMAQQLELDTCHHCQQVITDPSEFSIEHKEPWLDSDNPADKFFDLGNIAFSHLACNVRAARKPNQKYFTEEEKLEARRRLGREGMKRNYTTEKRQKKWRETGH